MQGITVEPAARLIVDYLSCLYGQLAPKAWIRLMNQLIPFADEEMRAESMVYDWMGCLCEGYGGSYWHFFLLSNVGMFMAPNSADGYGSPSTATASLGTCRVKRQGSLRRCSPCASWQSRRGRIGSSTCTTCCATSRRHIRKLH